MRAGRADCLVGVLDVFARFGLAERAKIFLAPSFLDERNGVTVIELRRNAGGIGSHVGDQTNMLPIDLFTFV